MFIVHVVPLLGGTDTTMSPSRHLIFCWISSLIHGGGPGRTPSCVASVVALMINPHVRREDSTEATLPPVRCDGHRFFGLPPWERSRQSSASISTSNFLAAALIRFHAR